MLGNDLTKGGIAKTLLRFTAPFLIANLLQCLYGIVDMFIVGRFADSAALSAVSIGSLLMTVVNYIIIGLATGGTVLIGQMIGARRERDMRETISTIFCLLPIVALILLAVFMAVREPLLRIIQTPAESMEGAEAYVRICLFGLIFTALYNAIASVLRAMGESKLPTVFIAFSCVFNIIGDIFCVGVLKMGAGGAALATVVSQALSVGIGYFYLRRHSFPFDFKPASFRAKKDKVTALLAIGLPAAAQETLINLSFIVLETIINRMGYIATAAVGVDDRIFSIAVIPATAFSAAIAAMVAQNTGAGLHRRSKKCLRIGLGMSFAIGVVIFAVMGIVPEAVIAIFSPDPLVIRTGTEYMTFFKYDFLLYSVAFCINGYINGKGHTRYTMMLNIVSSIVIRLPLVYFISRMEGATLYHIGIGLPVASLVQMLFGVGYLLFAKSERKQKPRPEGE